MVWLAGNLGEGIKGIYPITLGFPKDLLRSRIILYKLQDLASRLKNVILILNLSLILNQDFYPVVIFYPFLYLYIEDIHIKTTSSESWVYHYTWQTLFFTTELNIPFVELAKTRQDILSSIQLSIVALILSFSLSRESTMSTESPVPSKLPWESIINIIDF